MIYIYRKHCYINKCTFLISVYVLNYSVISVYVKTTLLLLLSPFSYMSSFLLSPLPPPPPPHPHPPLLLLPLPPPPTPPPPPSPSLPPQASNWCQKSQQFLSSTEEKVGGCDRSPEVARLIEELEVYLTATGDRQTEQVTLVRGRGQQWGGASRGRGNIEGVLVTRL